MYPRTLLCWILPFVLAGPAGAQESDPPAIAWHSAGAEEPVALPPFVVEDARGPAWRYVQTAEAEILSRCADAATLGVARRYARLHALLRLIVPEALRVRRSAPEALILYDEDIRLAAAREVVADMQRRAGAARAGAPAVSPPESRAAMIDQWEGRKTEREEEAPPPILPNLRLSDMDLMTACMLVPRAGFEPSLLRLQSGYVAELLRHRTPALPAWYVGGVLRIFAHARFLDDTVELAPLTWVSAEETRALAAGAEPRFLPLPAMLGFDGAAAAQRSIGEIDRWLAQAELLVRWALEPGADGRAGQFWRLVARAAAEPPTEAMLVECLGLDAARLAAALGKYLPAATRRPFTLRAGPPESLSPSIRDATPAEIGRIRGEFERLQIGYVRKKFPDYESRYVAQARRTFQRALGRSPRDSRLLAAAGLCETEAGDPADALRHLTAAVESDVARPRAYLELARLRYEAHRAQPRAEHGLDEAQTRSVITPLLQGLRQAPPLADAVLLLCEVRRPRAASLPDDEAAALNQGAADFRAHGRVLFAIAEIFLASGRFAEAEQAAFAGQQLGPETTYAASFREIMATIVARRAPRTAP